MDSAFGVDHGEVSKGFISGLPKDLKLSAQLRGVDRRAAKGVLKPKGLRKTKKNIRANANEIAIRGQADPKNPLTNEYYKKLDGGIYPNV